MTKETKELEFCRTTSANYNIDCIECCAFLTTGLVCPTFLIRCDETLLRVLAFVDGNLFWRGGELFAPLVKCLKSVSTRYHTK